MKNLTEEQEEQLGNKLARILKMKKYKPSKNEVARGWDLTSGWKTGKGLFRTIQGMMDEANETGDITE